MKDLTAVPNLSRFMKTVHREISGRPHHTFKDAYVAPDYTNSLTTVATIQSGGTSSVTVSHEVGVWVAAQPEMVTFLDEALKPQKPVRRPATAEENMTHSAHLIASDARPTFVSPALSVATLSVLHKRIAALRAKGASDLTIAQRITANCYYPVRNLFVGYSFEYTAIHERKLYTLQGIEVS